MLNISLTGLMSGYFLTYFNTLDYDDSIEIFNITQNPALMQGILSFCVPAGGAIGGWLSHVFIRKYSRQ